MCPSAPRSSSDRPPAALSPPATGQEAPTSALAVLLGGQRPGAERRARALLDRYPLALLSRFSVERLRLEGGVAELPARRVVAAFALGRAVERARHSRGEALSSPARVAHLMAPELRGLERETFHALVLDAKHRLVARTRVSEGTLSASLVHPREVFRPAIQWAGAALVVVHNHPSGDAEPSPEDLAVTRRLVDAGRLLGIELVDHLVLGDGAFVSIRERIGFPSGR